MQHIIIAGNIGGDATLTQGQRQQYRFSVGVYNGKDADGNSRTSWYTVFAPILQRYEGRLSKGTKVTVAGNLTTDIYIGSDGQSRLDLTINADAIEIQDSPVANPQRHNDPIMNGAANTYRQVQSARTARPAGPSRPTGYSPRRNEPEDMPSEL